MANEFKVKNGLIVIGDLTTSGTITINGALAATQSWVTSQAYLTSASLSGYATQSYVTSALAALVDAAPAALDTLNELAAALGDDASFSTTITNSIASKLSLSGGTLTGALNGTSASFSSNVTLGNNADLVFQDLAGTFPTSGKGFDWTLNNDGARIYAIQPNSDSIDFVFQLRDNATTNDRFVFWVAEWQGPAYDKYPLIISGGTQFDLKDSALYTNTVLRLSNSGVLQNVTGNISMFTNNAGYLTSYTETDTLATVTGRGATTNTSITVGHDLTVQADGGSGYTASRLWLNSHNNYRGAGVHMSGTGSTWFAGTPYTDFDGGYVIARTGTSNDQASAQYSNALLTVKSSGNVGIGTSNPGSKLSVFGNNDVFSVISQTGDTSIPTKLLAQYVGLFNNGANGHHLYINSSQELGPAEFNLTKTWGGLLTLGVSSDGTFRTRALYVNSNGYVGVNVNPISGDRFEVAGSVRIHTGNNWDAIQIYSDGANGYIQGLGDETGLRIRSEAGNILLADNRGNVGIGISSPSQKLNIEGNILLNLGGTLYLRDTTTYINEGSGLNLVSGATRSINLSAGGSERMRITATGDVGIGTSSPAAKLHVSSGQIQIGDSSSSFFGIRLSRTNSAVVQDAHLYSPSNNSPSVFYIEGGYYNSEAAGTVTAANSGYAYYERYFGNGAANSYKHLGFINVANGNFTSTNLVSSITMLSNGNVGIGTSSPGWKLHVAGESYTSGVVRIGGTNPFYFEDYGGGWYMADSSWVRTYNAKSVWVGGGLLGGDGGLTIGYGGTGSPSGGAIIAGNVGVGTSSPGAKLHVAGNAWINRPSNKVDNASCTELPSRVEFNNAFTAGSSGYTVFTYPTASVFRIYGDYDGNIGGLQPDLQLGLGYLTVKNSGGTIGNIGIGTTAPTHRLTVAGGNVLMFPSDNTRQLSFFSDSYGITASSGLELITGDYIRFRQGSTELARLTTTGLGIGTTSPSAKIHIVPTGTQVGLIADGTSVTAATANKVLDVLYNGGSSAFSVRSNGLVYIGYDSMYVEGAGITRRYWDSRIQFGTADLSSSTTGANVEVYGGLKVFRNVSNSSTSEIFRITNGGNVGIKVANPTATLSLGTSSYDSNPLTGLEYSQVTGGGRLDLKVQTWGTGSDYGLTTGLTVVTPGFDTNNVRVGIGTASPATPLHVTGGASGSGGWNRTATLAATYPGLIFNSNGTKWGGMAYDYSAAMRFWVNANNDDIFAGTLAMSILNNGNVGIGTSNPIYKLQVAGSAYVNGGTLFIDSGEYLRWGNSNQGIVGVNDSHVAIVSGGTTRQTIYAEGRTYFPGLDLSISNVNGSHGSGTYFRGDGGHFVFGLSSGNTLYLNYGNSAGILRTFGTWYHESTQILSTSRVLTNVSGNISMFTNDAGYLTSVSDVWVNTSGDTMTGALTIQGGWASTILDGDNVVLRKPNYSAGGWARTLLNFQEYDGTSLFQIGGYGSNNVMTYGYLGSAYNTPTIKWYANKNVYFSGNILIDDAADNNRYQKGATFLNLRDPWNNLHLSTDSIGGNYIDANVHYWRPAGGASYWMTLNGGNLGIGTTSPSQKLDVQGDISVGVSGATTVHTYYNSTTRNQIVYTNNSSFEFHEGANERVRIAAGGNVGIGTTAPEAKLHIVSGSGQAGFLSRGTNGDTWFPYTNGQNYVRGVTNFDLGSVYFTGGNIGIGTTSPSHKLHIKSSSLNSYPLVVQRAANTNNIFYIYEDGSGNGTLTLENSGGGAAVSIKSDGTSYLNGGNVGIGTTSPSAKLEISGFSTGAGLKLNYGNSSGTIEAVNFIANGGANGVIGMQMVSAGVGDLWLGGSGGRTLTLYRDGNVGIGTTDPTSQMSGTFGIGIYNALYPAVGFKNSTTAWLWYGQDSTFRMWNATFGDILTANTSGNIGIGTGSPSTKLDVNGVITATGGNSTNWNTAYSWGNHASAGYLTSYSETDPIYVSERNSLQLNKTVHPTLLFSTLADYNKPSGYSTMIQPGSYQTPLPSHGYYHIIARRDTSGGYGALLQSYNSHDLYHGNTTESTTNISWYKIWNSGDFTSTNVSNWNTAYGWGNHASAGYLTSLPSHNHDDRYYTESESDAKYLIGTTNPGSVGNFTLSIGNNGSYSYVQSHSGQPLRLNPVGNAVFVDSTLTVSGAVTGSNLNISNWDTAYSWGNHASASYATTSYVTTQINNLIAGAPGALDTLDELAAALGDDSNFATTVTNSIAGKVSKAGDTMTGNLTLAGGTNILFTGGSHSISGNNTGYLHFYDYTNVYFNNQLVIRGGIQNDGGNVLIDDNLNVAGELAFPDGGGAYSNIIRAAAYPSEGYPGGSNYWMEYRAKGGHHFILNTDGGVGAGLASMDDFVVWQGAIDGNRLLEVSNIGNLWIAGALTEASSLKLKENVETSEGNLEKVVNLRPVTYNKIGSQTTELGLIAEEVAEVYPEFVQYDESGEPVGVNYSRLTAALIGAVKELTNQVQELNKKING